MSDLTPRKSSPALLWTLLALGAICYFAIFAIYPGLFWYAGVNHYGIWFLDSFAVLASNDAVTRGMDPYASNPLDYFNRPHVYSHWWLYLRDLGLTRADNFWVGITMVGAFLGSALARLRPASPRQLLFYFAVLCSSPVLLAIDRANVDLVVFVLFAPLVSCLLDQRSAVRYLAPCLVAVAAALKYYPAAAGLVLLAAPPRNLRLYVAFALAALVLAFAGVRSDLREFGQLAPQPGGLLSFGAMAVAQTQGWHGWVPKLVCIALGATAFGWFWRSRPLEGWEVAPEQRSDWLHFVLGAVLLTGCFFTSLNFGYRWIFAIWMAPLLWWLPDDPTAPVPVRRLARITRVLLIAVLWIDAVVCFGLNRAIHMTTPAQLQAWADRLFLVEQPVFWAFFICVLAFLAHFARRGVKALFAR